MLVWKDKSLTEIVNQPLLQSNIAVEQRLAVERHQAKVDQREKLREKVDLEQLMLKAYWDKLYELSVYNRQRQLQASYIREGQIIDIEVKWK